MSVDVYVAVPAARWPDVVTMRRCVASHAYPVHVERFPVLDRHGVTTDGVLASIDGKEAYLEGALGPAAALSDDVRMINDRLGASHATDRIGSHHVLMTIHLHTPAEMRAASYVMSALIVCFDGFGFEPQGGTSGRADFVQALVSGSEMLKGL